ncbi:hypothetical protein ISN45_Aa01g006840 [Arabidopsis thaliana x Arabidopsis arenosa]|uniref:Uncharacterized protein n=1 Tax=Arabidopsis thaliana x Arabidopsis arenosa TaxID=1240361 RepID=A0A8T2BXK2_9BRAS|nr:hypothetical protein ISN45_Aa01g006840 [Arabidopsis thaliana x Arabidopsis arenosa]
MDLSREVDDFIKETIDHSLGLPISMDALKKKLNTAEESQRRLHEQYLSLVSRLKEKDKVIDLVRSEASMNAQSLRKFVEENQKLASECEDLVNQCKKWERECFLYHQDRESLMEFGNETDERAREAESRVRELEEEVRKMSDEIKNRIESEEDCLVDSILTSFVSKDESKSLGRIFLEANVEDNCCKTLLRKWDQLKPTTQKVVSLVSMVKRIEKEKQCLIMNLAKAEEEVELVSEQNRELDRENRKFLRQCSAERSHGSNKFIKRKSLKLMSSPIEKRIELSSQEFLDE